MAPSRLGSIVSWCSKATRADCLIECEHMVIWIEGKRNDWLAYSTTWDLTRDQLARNVEAAWILAEAAGKEFALIVCHEHPLKHHEQLLIDGYRACTWSGGLPHLSEAERKLLGSRIGTVTWSSLADQWPPLDDVREDALASRRCAGRRASFATTCDRECARCQGNSSHSHR